MTPYLNHPTMETDVILDKLTQSEILAQLAAAKARCVVWLDEVKANDPTSLFDGLIGRVETIIDDLDQWADSEQRTPPGPRLDPRRYMRAHPWPCYLFAPGFKYPKFPTVTSRAIRVMRGDYY